MCVHTDITNTNRVNWDRLILSKNVKKIKQTNKQTTKRISKILECILTLEWKHSLFMYSDWWFVLFTTGPCWPKCHWQMGGAHWEREAPFQFPELKLRWLQLCELMAHPSCIFHSTVSPDTCYHCSCILSVENWDITLRKYQLHCLQYHMPVWTHLLLLVGEQQRETGTETERDKRGRRRWVEVAL